MNQHISKILFVLVAFHGLLGGAEPRAFPGAEGWGANTKGGRGGKVLPVTTLKDYLPQKEKPIPGSLRAAIDARGPRTIVFHIAGNIILKDHLRIRHPFVTIAGQSAPGEGVCLTRYSLIVNTGQVIVRYLRVRPGDAVGRETKKPFETDAICVNGRKPRHGPVHNIIIDHCSTSWANDEVLSISGEGIDKVTVQWCFITESLNRSTHHKGEHGYGSLLCTNGRVSVHHNLYAFHKSRSPRPGTYPKDGSKGPLFLDFRSNAVYMGGKGYTVGEAVRMNYVGNVTRRTQPFHAAGNTAMYVDGNHSDKGRIWVPYLKGKAEILKKPVAFAPVKTDAADKLWERILENGGATHPGRDAVDRRIVKLISAGGGKLINSHSDVGGWPELKAAAAPADSDRDGMPDTWEMKQRLDPKRPDHNDDPDKDGYTNLEEFLNGTDPHKTQTTSGTLYYYPAGSCFLYEVCLVTGFGSTIYKFQKSPLLS